MKISLCMIVKNEEDNLSKCLECVHKYVDEIVIVDTGSTDDTKKIAERFTDKIFDFVWCSDFSAARNFSLEKAENDWVLVLDADEFVTEFNKKSLLSVVRHEGIAVGRINIVSILIDEFGTRLREDKSNRFFNKKYCCFEGIIHEQIVTKNSCRHEAISVGITCEHVGYIPDVIAKQSKYEMYRELLQRAIAEKPTDSFYYYHLGRLYFVEKQYALACDAFAKALELQPGCEEEHFGDLVEAYGYSLINTQRYAEALSLEKYRALYGNVADFCFVMGLIYMNNAMFDKAVEDFVRCTELPQGKVYGVNSYRALYNIGVIYECLGYEKEAIVYYEKCGDYEVAQKRLAVIHSRK